MGAQRAELAEGVAQARISRREGRPEESIRFHAEGNHFSNWLKARAEFALAVGGALLTGEIEEHDVDGHETSE